MLQQARHLLPWSGRSWGTPGSRRRSVDVPASCRAKKAMSCVDPINPTVDWSPSHGCPPCRSRSLCRNAILVCCVLLLQIPTTRRAVCAFSPAKRTRSEEHTSELQSRQYLVCRLLLEKKKKYVVLSITILL